MEVKYVITSYSIHYTKLYEDAKGNYQENNVLSVYGNYEMTEDITVPKATNQDGLTVMQGATLTIPEGITLTVEAGPTITNNGTIVNNGTIDLPVETTAEQLEASYNFV